MSDQSNLARNISDLLQMIAEDRQRAPKLRCLDEQHIAAYQRSEAAFEELSELARKGAKEAELDEARKVVNRLRSLADTLYRDLCEFRESLPDIRQKAKFLSKRLPLTPEWGQYKCILDDPEIISDPDTLEMRLGQMLALERSGPDAKSGGAAPAHSAASVSSPARRPRAKTKTDKEKEMRAAKREAFLKKQMDAKGWTSVRQIKDHHGPTYNTIVVYKRGEITTHTTSVRGDLARAFGCALPEVPE